MARPPIVSDRSPLAGSESSTKVRTWPLSLAGPVLPVRVSALLVVSSRKVRDWPLAVGSSLTQVMLTVTVADICQRDVGDRVVIAAGAAPHRLGSG